MTASGTSNKLHLSGCGGEENENFSSVKELLLDVEGAQESQRTHSLRLSIARWSPTHFTEAEPETTIGAINIRGSSKRTADSAGLKESEVGMHRLKKAQRAGQ